MQQPIQDRDAVEHVRQTLARASTRLACPRDGFDDADAAVGMFETTPLAALATDLALGALELDLLVALAVPHLRHVVTCPDEIEALHAAGEPTIEVLASAFAAAPDEAIAVRAALRSDAPLIQHGIVTPRGDTLRVDARIPAYLLGDLRIDERIADAVYVVRRPPAQFATAAASRLARALDTAGPIIVSGPARAGKTTAAVAAIVTGGRPALVADLDALEGRPDLLALLAREARLLRARLVLRASAWDQPSRAVRALFEGGAIVVARDASALARELAGARTIEIALPSPAEQEAMWCAALGDAAEGVSARYPLPAGDIVLAASTARAAAHLEQRDVTTADALAAARGRLRHRIGEVAELVATELTWSDLVLAPDLEASVRELVTTIRHRDRVMSDWGFSRLLPYGRSVTALLSGPPGTGKTMVATLLGKELGLEVFRVDLSKVVSKFIGETEKNLARVFDEARQCHAILLFDEADSLFARRTEVRSSNDRFANAEVNFLLQRIEAHDGIVLLTTNAATSIDRAFLRRIRFKLEFREPDETERRRLWRAMIPAGAPLAADVDFGALAARFALSGAHIKNAVVRAAFLAIGTDRSAIDHDALERSAEHEWLELGHLGLPPPSERTEPPRPPPPPLRPRTTELEARMIAILGDPRRAGETIAASYARKEAALAAVLVAARSADLSRVVLQLTDPDPADPLGAALTGITVERRDRLLARMRTPAARASAA